MKTMNKARLIFVLFISFSLSSFGQSLRDVTSIPLHSKFTLKLIPLDSNTYEYEVIKVEPYTASITFASIQTKFDSNLEKNMVQGFFGKGKFGNKESILLAMKNGSDKTLEYELFINTNGKKKFDKTSTVALSPNLPSIEMWPYFIHSIKILSFIKLH